MLEPAVAVELATGVMAIPLAVIAETLSTEVLVSSVARPTMRMRSAPVPTVCDQLAEAALVAVLVAALSNAIAAEALTEANKASEAAANVVSAARARCHGERVCLCVGMG